MRHAPRTRRPCVIALASASLALVASVAGAVAAPAQAPSGSADETPDVTNLICPVMSGERVDPDLSVEVDGQRVYVCCRRCLVKLEKNPERYGPQITAAMQISDQMRGEDNEPPEPPDETTSREAADTAADDAEHKAASEEPEEDAEAGEQTPPAGDSEPPEPQPAISPAPEDGLPPILQWLGRFHPASVHFPVAMLIGAAVAEILRMATGATLFAGAVRFCIWFGVITTLISGTLGWFYAGIDIASDDWLLGLHRWLGTFTGVWVIALAAVDLRAHGPSAETWRRKYTLTILAGAVLAGVVGFLGGALVYGLDHYAL